MRKLRQEFSKGVRQEKSVAPQPFCQEPASLSGGILAWPRPGLARRAARAHEAKLRLRPGVVGRFGSDARAS
jgi:hypothetical protein